MMINNDLIQNPLIENPLIPIYIDETGNGFVVGGRNIHSFVESRKDYTSWAKYENEINELKEGTDFGILTKKMVNSKGRPQTEYMYTLAAASLIAQGSHTKKGLEARKFFFNCAVKLAEVTKNSAVVSSQKFDIEKFTKEDLAKIIFEIEQNRTRVEKELVIAKDEIQEMETLIEKQTKQIIMLENKSQRSKIITIHKAASELKIDSSALMCLIVKVLVENSEIKEYITTYTNSANAKTKVCIKKENYRQFLKLIKTVA